MSARNKSRFDVSMKCAVRRGETTVHSPMLSVLKSGVVGVILRVPPQRRRHRRRPSRARLPPNEHLLLSNSGHKPQVCLRAAQSRPPVAASRHFPLTALMVYGLTIKTIYSISAAVGGRRADAMGTLRRARAVHHLTAGVVGPTRRAGCGPGLVGSR